MYFSAQASDSVLKRKINVVVHTRTCLLAQFEEAVVEKRKLARSLEEGEEIGGTRVGKSKQCSRNA